jgi:hypothetical protein
VAEWSNAQGLDVTISLFFQERLFQSGPHRS